MTAAPRGSALAVARELVDRLGVSRAASVAETRIRDADLPTPAARYWAAVFAVIRRIGRARLPRLPRLPGD